MGLTAAKLESAHLKLPTVLRHTAALEKWAKGVHVSTHSVANSNVPDLSPKMIQLPEFAGFSITTSTFAAVLYKTELDLSTLGVEPRPNDRITVNGRTGRVNAVRVDLAGHRFVCLCQQER